MQFAEILEGKLRAELREELHQALRNEMAAPQATPSSIPAVDTEFAHLAWLLGQTPTHRSPVAAAQTPYRQWAPKPKPRPPHALNAAQGKALALLQSWDSTLLANFTRPELKRAFRVAALKTHPDRGGQATDFQAAQAAFLELSLLFKTQ